MGVTRQSFDFFHKYFNKELHKSICELGDQQFMLCPPYKEYSYTRTFFKNVGILYDAIDLNGLNNSLMLDLNTEFPITTQYDFITDFGTLEHVSDFYMGWKNTDRLCKIGGTMLHILPALNHWPDHGSWRGDRTFFVKLGKSQEYEIKDIHTESTHIGGVTSDQIYVVYVKTQDKFVSRETFESFGPIKLNEPEVYLPGKVGGGRDINIEK